MQQRRWLRALLGSAGVVGWARVPAVDAVQWFVLAGGATMLIRMLLARAAAAIDRARGIREEAVVRRF